MANDSLRTAITNAGGTPTRHDRVGLWRELVSALGGTPTQYTVTGLIREAITAAGGTPTQRAYIPLLRELVTALGGTPTSHNAWDLVAQVAANSSGGASGNTTDYRYYQLSVSAVGSGQFASYSEIELAETIGGADITPTVSIISANGYFNGASTYQPGNSIDNNVDTIFHSDDRNAAGWPSIVTLDFGATAANWPAVNQLKISSRNDGNHNQAPKDFKLRASHDNASFVDLITVTGEVNWPGTTAYTNTYTVS